MKVQVSAKAHPLTDSTQVTEVLSARFTKAEMNIINELIDAAGVTRSEWLRDVVLARSKPERDSERRMDEVLLEEITMVRSLILNLFASAGIPRASVQSIASNADNTKMSEAKKRLDLFPRGTSGGAVRS